MKSWLPPLSHLLAVVAACRPLESPHGLATELEHLGEGGALTARLRGEPQMREEEKKKQQQKRENQRTGGNKEEERSF